MTLHRRHFLYFSAAIAGLSLSRGAKGQDYPTQTVRLIVPLSAGSAADALSRLLAQKMSKDWGQPVVVENKPGAGTTLGADLVAKAAPDGHTLLVNSASFAASAVMHMNLPYDPLKDFAPASQIAAAPMVVVASPSLGARSLKELIAIAKKNPGRLNFGSAGIGSSSQFAAEQLDTAAGIKVVHVPYKGPSEALAESATGRIQYSVSPLLPALPFIKDGRLIALGVTTVARSPMLPNVPTVAEAGLPGYEYQDWWGVFAPGATPPAIVEKISKEIAHAVGDPSVAKFMLSQGVQAQPSSPVEFTRFVHARITGVRQMAAAAGLRPQ